MVKGRVDKSTSPLPSGPTWFVNIPKGITSSIQVRKKNKKILEKKLKQKNENIFASSRIRTHGPQNIGIFTDPGALTTWPRSPYISQWVSL